MNLDFLRKEAQEYYSELDDYSFAGTNMNTPEVAKRFIDDFLDYVEQGLDASD